MKTLTVKVADELSAKLESVAAQRGETIRGVLLDTEPLAAGCLVRMNKPYPPGRVFTLDSDFASYRRNGRQKIATLIPT